MQGLINPGTTATQVRTPPGVPSGSTYDATYGTFTDSSGKVWGMGGEGVWVVGRIVQGRNGTGFVEGA